MQAAETLSRVELGLMALLLGLVVAMLAFNVWWYATRTEPPYPRTRGETDHMIRGYGRSRQAY